MREEKAAKAKPYFRIFAIISNETMDAMTALDLYSNKDLLNVTCEKD